MPRYGAIYLAHNPNDGKNVYKVGLTTRSVQERMDELTAETSNIGRYVALGHVVVTDVDAAENACHTRLNTLRIQDNREFFCGELKDIVITVRASCKPYAIAEGLPPIDDPNSADDLDRVFEESIEKKEKNAQMAADRAARAYSAFEEAVSTLADDCAALSRKLANKSDQIRFEIFPKVPGQDTALWVHYKHVVCRVVLSAPIKTPVRRDGTTCQQIRFHELAPRLASEKLEWLTVDDDGTYAVLELGAEILQSHRLRFTIEGRTPHIERGWSEGVFKRKMVARENASARLMDLNEARLVFVRFVAVNTDDQPETVRRGYYSERGSVGHSSRTFYKDYWENQSDCKLDVTVLRPYVHRPDSMKPKRHRKT